MNKFYIILLFILGGANVSFAQDGMEGQYLQFSGGAKYNTLYDNSVGIQHFQGLALSSRFAYRSISEDIQWWTELKFDGGFYNTFNFPSISSRTANHISGGYNFGVQFPVYDFSEKWHLWAGGSLTGRYTYNQIVNFSNSQDNYTFLNNLGVNSLVQYSFVLFERDFNLEWYFNIPLTTYYMRPGYSVNYPDGEVGESGFTSFNGFFELDSEIRLVFPFYNNNKLALEYHWDYYSLKTSNKVQYASHGLFVTAYFKLNND